MVKSAPKGGQKGGAAYSLAPTKRARRTAARRARASGRPRTPSAGGQITRMRVFWNEGARKAGAGCRGDKGIKMHPQTTQDVNFDFVKPMPIIDGSPNRIIQEIK